MLKQRIMTALILIPLFLALLFELPPVGFAIFTLVMVVLAGWEWSTFLGIKPLVLRACYPILLYGFISVFIYIPVLYLMFIAIVWWCFACGLVLRYPAGAAQWGNSKILRGMMGLFVLIPCWRGLNFIRDTNLYGINHSLYVLLYLFVLIWGADSGAYFVGKKWGKHKLAPSVSPGKTWQGLAGALIVTALLSPLFLVLVPTANLMLVMLLGMVTVVFSVLGDLFESMLKRNVNVKDSGYLVPGHGGLMDRIDSLTAAVPVFVLGSWLVVSIK